MKKLFSIVAIVLFLPMCPKAQAPDTLWTKTYGGAEWEVGFSVQQTTDGGYIIAGQTNTFGAGGNDIYLIKTDSEGDTIWTMVYGSTGDEIASSVWQTIDGGYVLAGKTNPSGESNPDAYLIKTNAEGDTLWTRTYGGGDDDEINSVIQTDDGYYIALGTTRSFGQGNADFYFVETSPAADTVWDDTFGGFSNDYGQAVQETDDGYILAGSTANFGSGNFDAWLVRIDYEYEIFWHKAFGGADADNAYDVQPTADGGFISAGSTKSFGPGDRSFFLFKASASGDSLWANVFGGEDRDECRSVKQTPNGGYIMAGSSKSFGTGNFDWYIVRTDANGDSLWTKVFGGTQADDCYSVQLTDDGGYIIAGSTRSFGAGNSDVWLIKLAPDPVSIHEYDDLTGKHQMQICPNPINNLTSIKYSLTVKSDVILRVYDLFGKEVATICNTVQLKGPQEIIFNGTDLPSGIYYCVLRTSVGIQTTKLIKM